MAGTVSSGFAVSLSSSFTIYCALASKDFMNFIYYYYYDHHLLIFVNDFEGYENFS